VNEVNRIVRDRCGSFLTAPYTCYNLPKCLILGPEAWAYDGQDRKLCVGGS